MWGRRSVTRFAGRLGDRVARTARRWTTRGRKPPAPLGDLSIEQRRQLADELGLAVSRDAARPDPPPARPDPAPPRPEPDEPGASTGRAVDGDPPLFIGSVELDAMDPPHPRGALRLAPDQDGPIYAVAERLFDPPSDVPAQDVGKGAIERTPAAIDKEDEVIAKPQPPEPGERPRPPRPPRTPRKPEPPDPDGKRRRRFDGPA